MRTSYWNICFVGADGEEICTELFAELPPELDGSLQIDVAALAELEEMAAQTPDLAFQIRLVEVMDEAAIRLNDRLPEGAILRRVDEPVVFADDEGTGFVGVPGVVGLSHTEGFQTLRDAGYGVRTVWEWTSPDEEGTITGQEPEAGAPNLPPTVVAISVRTLPPEKVRIPEPVTILKS